MSGPALVLRSRRLVLPEGERPGRVVVREGRIEAIEAWDARGAVTDELGDLPLLPGLVDTHVHVNEPGRTEWEGFETATRAAAAGGITTFVDMPLNSVPPTVRPAALREKVRAMAGHLHVDVGLWGGLVPGNAGDLEGLAREGALGFKCFMAPSGVEEFGHVAESDLHAALPIVARLGLPLLAHAEDPEHLRPLPAPTRRHADWLASRPAAAEAAAIRVLGRLARDSGARVHVVHVASSAALAALREAAEQGDVSGETCPHYLVFASEEVADGDVTCKCAPPLRGAAERDALRRAVLAGALALVASDHSPAPPALKDPAGGDFARAWGGIASLELSAAAVWTALAPAGARLADLVRRMSAEPARLAGLEGRKGALVPGADADLVAFDPEARWTVDRARLYQRHAITPYHGRTLLGRVRRTYLRGTLVFDAGAFPAPAGGRWLRRDGAVEPARAFGP